MDCKNHPGIEAIDRCKGCAEAFCPNCLVEIRGQKYCAECKHIAFAESETKVVVGTMPNEYATKALQYAIASLFCFGFVLGPMAISKAMEAKRTIEKDPRFDGAGKANAALIIGIIGLVVWVLGLLSRFVMR